MSIDPLLDENHGKGNIVKMGQDVHYHEVYLLLGQATFQVQLPLSLC